MTSPRTQIGINIIAGAARINTAAKRPLLTAKNMGVLQVLQWTIDN